MNASYAFKEPFGCVFGPQPRSCEASARSNIRKGNPDQRAIPPDGEGVVSKPGDLDQRLPLPKTRVDHPIDCLSKKFLSRCFPGPIHLLLTAGFSLRPWHTAVRVPWGLWRLDAAQVETVLQSPQATHDDPDVSKLFREHPPFGKPRAHNVNVLAGRVLVADH
ncbi:hypothetical protein [Geothrix sp. SG200]|uniref:hypothetical protein n=1 Tax=Geothrix sp. SG200 TaxID=2922865 RepID=UPI001FAD38A9|nr:hypothetical protein [Geothrix sp. SG200]